MNEIMGMSYASLYYAEVGKNNELQKEIENLKNIISSIKEDYLNEKAKIDKILDYLDTKFTQGLNYSEWTDGYNECINKHKSNLQNILQGDD